MLVSVTAIVDVVYAGVPYAKGRSFRANQEDARLLRLIGKVSWTDAAGTDDPAPAPGTPTTSARRYRRRDLVAESS